MKRWFFLGIEMIFFNKIDLLLENHLKRKEIEKNLEKFFKKDIVFLIEQDLL